jgi:hypothetical protein
MTATETCHYCGHNAACFLIDDKAYCTWDCMTDDYEAEARRARQEEEENR